ncbi:MAG: hypothetical protein HQK97_06240 [Nitrospirae bacterium]|nr:hypothetical protein [Nitrospirota bacterium]
MVFKSDWIIERIEPWSETSAKMLRLLSRGSPAPSSDASSVVKVRTSFEPDLLNISILPFGSERVMYNGIRRESFSVQMTVSSSGALMTPLRWSPSHEAAL